MIDKLKAKKVVRDRCPGAVLGGLADAAQTFLKTQGVTTHRESVTVDQTDFSSIVTKIPSDTDVVFIPWQ